jgi:hypothetical protein
MQHVSFPRCAAVAACVFITCATRAGVDATTRVVRAYHVGNSLTFGAFPNNETAKLFESRGGTYTRGTHILWGSPLARIWENPASNNAPVAPFGSFSNALTAFDWDVLTLQPIAGTIAGAAGDLMQCRRCIGCTA